MPEWFSWPARRLVLLTLVFGCVSSAQSPRVERPAVKAVTAADRQREAFVDHLLKQMTLDEKIGQMTQIAYQEPDVISHDDRVLREQVGSFLFVTDPKEINRLQHVAVEKTRLHIPLLFGFDVVHGFRTIFPVPLAMAASWDPKMVERAQGLAAQEASAVGVRWTFAPMVDIARDARWGRIMEGAGEDPYLGEQMAMAQVKGFQGTSSADAPIDAQHVMACVKHFAGYGAAEGGRDYDQSDISDELLWNVYLPPFHAAVKAGAGSLMSAYMDLNDVPATGNQFLLTQVLRQDWGFKGFVVSDWGAVKNLTTHGFAADGADAAALAANAGVDMEMSTDTFRKYLAEDVKTGKVSMATVNAAVRSILEAKYKLGLFAHPYVDEAKVASLTETPEVLHEAKVAAERSAVLLRDENGVLPLSKHVQSVAVVGPFADSKVDTMGSWSLAGDVNAPVTVLEGIRRKLGPSVQVRYAKGVEVERGQASIFDKQFPEPKPTLLTDAEKEAAFQQAIEAVRKSDVAVLVLGEAQNMSGERASRATLTLPGKQEQLLEAAVATGKPVVLVLMNGRPLNITWASQHVPGILEAWYPGTEGGDAVADLLFGDAVPGGKLPVSWPRSVGQEPLYYNHTLSHIPHDRDAMYWDESSAPLYPFGYGLSYARLSISGLTLASDKVARDGMLHATVTVKNSSAMAADEVVELYVHQRSGSASRPVRELKAFRRVTVGAGESKDVALDMPASELAFWDPQSRKVQLEPGVFDVWVGDSSATGEHATFELMP